MSPPRRPWLAALLSAALLWAAFPPLDLGFLAAVALVPWWSALAARERGTGLASFLLGFAFFLGSLAWLLWVTVPGWVALCAYLALYFLAFDLLWRFLRRRLPVPPSLLAAVLWTALEYVRATLFTGFPWLLLGHAAWRMRTLLQSADLAGAYGLTFLFALANALAAAATTNRRASPAGHPSGLPERLAAAALVALSLAYGAWRIRTLSQADGPRVASVQMDVRLSPDREPPDGRAVFEAILDLAKRVPPGSADLVVWPETMVAAPLDDSWPAAAILWPRLRNAARGAGCPILVGAFGLHPRDGDPGAARRCNSAWLVEPAREGPAPRYDKMHLVPFGEYIPLGEALPFLRYLVPAAFRTGMHAGRRAVRFPAGRWTFAVAICFEDTVPGVARRLLREGGEGKADFLVNISNDGWYNGWWEFDQHLVGSVFRAVENRVPVVRSVNGGATAVVDPLGRVARIRLDSGSDRGGAGILRAPLRTSPAVTLYARAGDIFAQACLAASALLVAAAVLRGPRAAVPPQG